MLHSHRISSYQILLSYKYSTVLILHKEVTNFRKSKNNLPAVDGFTVFLKQDRVEKSPIWSRWV